jgi:hypothetical protein
LDHLGDDLGVADVEKSAAAVEVVLAAREKYAIRTVAPPGLPPEVADGAVGASPTLLADDAEPPVAMLVPARSAVDPSEHHVS